jgi:hypothetical protein
MGVGVRYAPSRYERHTARSGLPLARAARAHVGLERREQTHVGAREHAFGEDKRNAGAHQAPHDKFSPRRRDASWGI